MKESAVGLFRLAEACASTVGRELAFSLPMGVNTACRGLFEGCGRLAKIAKEGFRLKA